MSNIYTGIEFGSNSIKVVVCEKVGKKFNVLSATSSASQGIRNGQVFDIKQAISSVKKALKQAGDMLGVKITKVIACCPPTDCRMDIVVGCTDVENPEGITGEDISNALNDAIKGQDFREYELITATPISFKVDEEENIKDPKGMAGHYLETRVVIATSPKENLYRILEVLKLCGVEAVDVAFTSTGDYFSVKNNKFDMIVGAIVNIGETSTNISIFNKGIQIKNATVPVGSNHVDRDLAYIFKVELEEARKVKETFAVSLANYADPSDMMDVKTKTGERKEISQVGASKIVEARVKEILNLTKNEIKNLTNREIRYIIITGGLSELAGFSYLIEEEFGEIANVCNISTMGVRHNKYSSALGVIKYFDDKLALRGKSYNMLNNDDIESLISTQQKLNNNDNIISKVFGHFFDN